MNAAWTSVADAGPEWDEIVAEARREVLSSLLGSDLNRLAAVEYPDDAKLAEASEKKALPLSVGTRIEFLTYFAGQRPHRAKVAEVAVGANSLRLVDVETPGVRDLAGQHL